MSIVKQYFVNLQTHHSGDRWSSPPNPSTSPPTWKHLTGQCHWPLADTGCAIPRSVASHIVVSWWVLMRTLLIWSLMTCDHDLYILLVEPVETWTEYITPPPTHKNDVIGNVDRIIFFEITWVFFCANRVPLIMDLNLWFAASDCLKNQTKP